MSPNSVFCLLATAAAARQFPPASRPPLTPPPPSSTPPLRSFPLHETLFRRGRKPIQTNGGGEPFSFWVRFSRCIDRKENEPTHSKVVETLSLIRKQNTDERAIKKSRARERIDAENKVRIEKALSAMKIGRERNANVTGRIQRAPAHLRPILTIFLSPEFKKAFLAYAQRVARGEISMPSGNFLLAKQAPSAAATSESVTAKTGAAAAAAAATPATPATAAVGGSGATAAATEPGGKPPPRRAISLDYPETCPGHVVTTAVAAAGLVPPLARGAARRRQVMFGDVPPTKSEANMIAAGRHRESIFPPGVQKDGAGAAGKQNQQQKHRGRAGSRSGSTSKVKWRKHSGGSDFDMTLTADTAKGRTVRTPSQGGADGGSQASPTGQGWSLTRLCLISERSMTFAELDGIPQTSSLVCNTTFIRASQDRETRCLPKRTFSS